MATPPTFTSGAVLTAAQMNSVGLWLVKTQTIGNAVSSVTVTGAFSADYPNYKIVLAGGVGSATQAIALNLDGSTAGYYYSHISATYAVGVPTNSPGANVAAWTLAGVSSVDQNFVNCDILSPQAAKPAGIQGSYINGSTTGNGGTITGYHASLFQATGFRLVVAGTMTGGTIYVYGYKGLV